MATTVTKRTPTLVTTTGVADNYVDQDGSDYTDDTLNDLYQAGISLTEIRDNFTVRVDGAEPTVSSTVRVPSVYPITRISFESADGDVQGKLLLEGDAAPGVIDQYLIIEGAQQHNQTSEVTRRVYLP